MKHMYDLQVDIYLKELFEKNKVNSNVSAVDFEFLPTFINDLFKLALAIFEESILIIGPTGYKTFFRATIYIWN